MKKPKRSLGQNFFVNTHLAERIVDTVLEEKPDFIVEIGPGKGFFTKIFKEKFDNMLVVEKDYELARVVEDLPVTTLNTDFLDWNFTELEKYKEKKITFFGSLPYNVSKKIISKIIESKYFNTSSYFIIQKEVAEKYTADAPNNNFLAIRTKLYSESKRILNIKADSFRPRPNVESSLIKITPNKKEIENLDGFTAFLEECFRQPRKILGNNLRRYYFTKSFEVEKLLSKRPQHLTLGEYILLFSHISKPLI